MRREKSFRVFSCQEQIKGRIKGIKKDGISGRQGRLEGKFLHSKRHFYPFAVAIRTKKMVESIENEKKLTK